MRAKLNQFKQESADLFKNRAGDLDAKTAKGAIDLMISIGEAIADGVEALADKMDTDGGLAEKGNYRDEVDNS